MYHKLLKPLPVVIFLLPKKETQIIINVTKLAHLIKEN